MDPAVPEPNHGLRLGYPVLVGAALVACAVVAWHITAFPIANPFYGLFNNYTDLRVYRAGAETVLDGRPLYSTPLYRGLGFTYPPFSAIVLVPLALMGPSLAHVVWWMVGLAALMAVIVIGLRSLGYRLDTRTWVFAGLLTVASTALEPIRTTLWLGQINIVLMFLVVVDLVLLESLRPNSRLRGVGVGLAAGLKLTPLFFVIYLLAIRRRFAALVALATFGVTIIVGFVVIPGDAWEYWTRDIAGESRIGRVDSPANQSINGFLSQMLAYFDVRRFAHRVPDGPPVFEAPTWMWVPIALVAVGLGLWAAVLAHRAGRHLLSVTIAGMTASTVSPFSWGHHWVWFVPLMLVAFDVAYRSTLSGCRNRLWWWAAPAAIAALSFTWWYHWWGVGPRLGADHPIALGLFMMPRWPDPHWWDYLASTLYAGCYPLVLLGTIVVTLIACRKGTISRRRVVVGSSEF